MKVKGLLVVWKKRKGRRGRRKKKEKRMKKGKKKEGRNSFLDDR